MQKRRTLRTPFSLAALAVCGMLLGGCGDDGGGSINDLSDPNPNQPPVCNVVAAFVDLVTQEVVVDVDIFDPDQLSPIIGMEVTVDIITNAGTFGNDILSASSGDLIVGNTVFNVAYTNTAPGAQTRFNVSSTTPDLLPSDPTATVRVTVVDESGGTVTCTLGVDLSLLLSEPTCAISAPGPTDMGSGNIDVTFDVVDSQGDLAQASVYWSPDGGTTLNGATLTATTAGTLGGAANNCDPANPYTGGTVTDIPTTIGGAPTTLTVTWDSLADGAGATALETVTLVIFTEDCSTVAIGGSFNGPCMGDTMVLNNAAPACTVDTPTAGASLGGTGIVPIGYTTMDTDTANLGATFFWSNDGGATWNMATAGAPNTNPETVPTGAGTFNWDVPADLPAASLPADVSIRITVDDGVGRMPLPECVGPTFTLVPISEPTCTITAPGAGVCVDAFPAGTVTIDIDVADAQGDPINFSVCYDTGGGAMPATLTGTSNGVLAGYAPTDGAACVGATNQVTGAAAGVASVTWDIVADGLGGMACDAVTITVFPEDGTTAGVGPFSNCTQAFSVSNNGAPSCVVNSINDSSVNFDLTDADSASVMATFSYSTDGGATFTMATAGGASTNPEAFAPGAGIVLTWAGTTDIPMCTTGVIVRVSVDDGVALANRPATCDSAPTDINCIPLLSACAAVDVLGATATGPTGVVPAYLPNAGMAPPLGDITFENPFASNFWDFDYNGLNQGIFNLTIQLTDAGGNNVGNPVVLYSAGNDYSGFVDGGVCNAADSFQMVLQGDIGGVLMDFSAASTPFMTTTIDTVWTSSDPASISVSANGLLDALAENVCVTIDWAITSGDPLVVAVDPTCAAGSFAACVDSSGVDVATRTTWMPMGDIDGNYPGYPSGWPAPAGVGSTTAVTFIVNTGAEGAGAYAATTLYNEAVLDEDNGVDAMSIGGSTSGLSTPLAVNTLNPGETRYNGVDAFASDMGIFDISGQTFTTTGAGTTLVQYVNEELANGAACTIWILNPCMPFNTTICGPIPAGGYTTIAGTANVTVP